MSVDGVSVHVGSLDITNFARMSAAHFGWSLMLYGCRALQHQRESGLHESLQINLKQFQQDIEGTMDTFLQMELTSEFIDAYKRRKVKCLFIRPIFLVLPRNEVLCA